MSGVCRHGVTTAFRCAWCSVVVSDTARRVVDAAYAFERAVHDATDDEVLRALAHAGSESVRAASYRVRRS